MLYTPRARVSVTLTFSLGELKAPSLALMPPDQVAPPLRLYWAEAMLEFPVVTSLMFAVIVVDCPAATGLGVARMLETTGPESSAEAIPKDCWTCAAAR